MSASKESFFFSFNNYIVCGCSPLENVVINVVVLQI